MIGEERAALEAFIVDNADLERLEGLLAEFNIFEALGATHVELRHSDFLAFLLDPMQNHGLGDAFLKRLLMRLLSDAETSHISPVEIDVADLWDAEVRREWQDIDIFIHLPTERMVFAIENKVASGEHGEQLKRYREIVRREFAGYRAEFVFLTPDGQEPSDEQYIPFSYRQIADLIDTVHSTYESTLGAEVAALLKHYSAMLRRHIVSDSEIPELCRKIYRRHRKAVDIIFEHKPDLQADVAETLRELIQSAKDANLLLDRAGKSAVYFAPAEWDQHPAQKSGVGWTTSGRVVLFEFWIYSEQLRLGLYIGPAPQPLRDRLFQKVLDTQGVFHGHKKVQAQKWTRIYNEQFLSAKDYEDVETEGLREKLIVRWQNFLKDRLPGIRKALDEAAWDEPAV